MGRFISFEGIEGSGKSTQVRTLADALEGDGREVVCTREPGGVGIASSEAIRELLLRTDFDLDARTELLLFLASRAEHVSRLIGPALERGAVVLTDRFADASTAYQGAGRGIDVEFVDQLSRFATGGIWPDLTILLDLAPEVGLERVRAGRSHLDRIEREALEFHGRVREGYLDLARREPQRFVVMSADASPEQISRDILVTVRARLG